MVFPVSLIKEKNVYNKYIENLQTSLYWCDLELSNLKKSRFSFFKSRKKSPRKSRKKSPRKSRKKSR